MPPHEPFDDDEKEMYAWLLSEHWNPVLHAGPDAQVFASLARTLIAQRCAEAKVAEIGPIIKHPISGKPMKNPFATRAGEMAALAERLQKLLGFAPLHRLKFAPLLKHDRDLGSWKDFD